MSMTRLRRLGTAALCAAVVLGTVGCPPSYVRSSDIATSAFWVNYVIEETKTDDGELAVLAIARFSVGRPLGTRVMLTDGDVVTVNGVEMENRPVGALPRYEAAIELADEYEFVLERPGEGGYVSSGTPPPIVSIEQPVTGTPLSRADVIELLWEDNNTGGKIDAFLTHRNSAFWKFGLDDTGNYLLDPEDFWDGAGQLVFDARIGLRRQNRGAMHPALEGRMDLFNKHAITFSSIP